MNIAITNQANKKAVLKVADLPPLLLSTLPFYLAKALAQAGKAKQK